MRITIENDDKSTPNVDRYKKLIYGETCDLDTAQEWDYMFQHLKEHIAALKAKKETEINLGKGLSLQAKIDTLQKFIDKYINFIELAEDERYSGL